MIPYLDKNKKPLTVGQTVRVQYCCGSYGQTNIVSGEIVNWHEYGINISLSPNNPTFTDGNKFCRGYSAGQLFCVPLSCFSYNFDLKAAFGFSHFESFDHDHDSWCEIV